MDTCCSLGLGLVQLVAFEGGQHEDWQPGNPLLPRHPCRHGPHHPHLHQHDPHHNLTLLTIILIKIILILVMIILVNIRSSSLLSASSFAGVPLTRGLVARVPRWESQGVRAISDAGDLKDGLGLRGTVMKEFEEHISQKGKEKKITQFVSKCKIQIILCGHIVYT